MSVNINGGSMRIEASVHTALTMHKVSSSNFVKLNDSVEDQNSFSRTIASRDMLYEAQNISKLQSSMTDTLTGLKSAQGSFDIVKDNVDRIQELVQQAYDGALSGTQLNDAQDEINSLVSQIQDITDNTQIKGQNIFDGSFSLGLNTGLKSTDNYNLDFTQGSIPVGTPDLVSEIFSPNGDEGDQFWVRYVDENYMVATARNNDNEDPEGLNDNNGSVYIFDADTRSLITEIVSPLTDVMNERFGHAIDVQGNKILIGTNNYDANPSVLEDLNFAGAAFMYNMDTGEQLASFTHEDAATGVERGSSLGSNFGNSVQFAGDSVFVHIQYERDTGNGVAIEYDHNGQFIKKHVNPNGSLDSGFKVTDTSIIFENKVYNQRQGQMYVMSRETGEITATINSPNPQVGHGFGWHYDVVGDKLLVGAYGYRGGATGDWADNDYAGEAFLFDLSGSNPVLERSFVPPPGNLDGFDSYGAGVKIVGDYAIIGAPGDDDAGSNSGATYAFELNTGNFVFKAAGVYSTVVSENSIYSLESYNNGEGKTQEFDFLSALGISETSLNLNTNTVAAGSLGGGSFSALNKISISDITTNNAGTTGVADLTTTSNIQSIKDNIIRMEAILDSKTQRVQSEFDRLQSEKEAKLDTKVFLDDKLIADTYFNPYAIENQFNDPYQAVNLLP
ncbi:MAG: hypothetical protein HRT47_00600 [Candidatus Caenarcaniphilales bacterium]|nr:hypothetical protein [Candidatus Caenarcaniphilales bacterium]